MLIIRPKVGTFIFGRYANGCNDDDDDDDDDLVVNVTLIILHLFFNY